jgi:hypothetical protein
MGLTDLEVEIYVNTNINNKIYSRPLIIYIGGLLYIYIKKYGFDRHGSRNLRKYKYQ